jgi:hypothetical protein
VILLLRAAISEGRELFLLGSIGREGREERFAFGEAPINLALAIDAFRAENDP